MKYFKRLSRGNAILVFVRFGRLKREEMSVEDYTRSGRTSSSRKDENIEKTRILLKKIYEDCRFMIVEISEQTGVKQVFVLADFNRGLVNETYCH